MYHLFHLFKSNFIKPFLFHPFELSQALVFVEGCEHGKFDFFLH